MLNSDVSLVMYYAPWDLDSQLAIHDFEKIAAKYEGQVCIIYLCISFFIFVDINKLNDPFLGVFFFHQLLGSQRSL